MKGRQAASCPAGPAHVPTAEKAQTSAERERQGEGTHSLTAPSVRRPADRNGLLIVAYCIIAMYYIPAKHPPHFLLLSCTCSHTEYYSTGDKAPRANLTENHLSFFSGNPREDTSLKGITLVCPKAFSCHSVCIIVLNKHEL